LQDGKKIRRKYLVTSGKTSFGQLGIFLMKFLTWHLGIFVPGMLSLPIFTCSPRRRPLQEAHLPLLFQD
jgi:hypothetical protein